MLQVFWTKHVEVASITGGVIGDLRAPKAPNFNMRSAMSYVCLNRLDEDRVTTKSEQASHV